MDIVEELAIARELEITRRERDEARRESEARFDCHAGPGTTEPACGACVTCLLRDIEAAHAERDEARAALRDAQDSCAIMQDEASRRS